MKFFRNSEVKRQMFAALLVTAVSLGAGFSIGRNSGLVILASSTAFGILIFISTYMRYRKISQLSAEIDYILQGKEKLDFSQFAEGELSILQNEVSKLTVKLREQAGQLSKDKSYLADLIADISHQIRTPLTSINIISSMLIRPELSDEKRVQYAKELRALLIRIDWLVDSLLKMSKLDAGTANLKKTRVNLKELIQKASEPLAIPMELRGQELNVAVNEVDSFEGDMQWSTEAIGNILKNCMEHTPKGGNINVSACENALYTEIVITDNGTGIAKEDLPHIFERFYKGKDSGSQSIGIGLALARMIVAEQSGTIKAENLQSGGAKFTVRFYKSVI